MITRYTAADKKAKSQRTMRAKKGRTRAEAEGLEVELERARAKQEGLKAEANRLEAEIDQLEAETERYKAESERSKTLFNWWTSLTAHIDWDALAEDAGQAVPTTELERVDLLIRVANGDKLDTQDWCSLMGTRVADYPGGDDPIPTEAREKLASNLRLLTDAPGKAARELKDWIVKFLTGRIAQIPYLTNHRGQIVVRYQIRAATVLAALAYGLLLFADPARPFARRLCYCHYEKCGRFFLAEVPTDSGRPERLYCPGGKCRKAQVKIQNRRRVAEFRKRERLSGAFAEREL